ncbi:uroporphyrinogen-III synthase [Jeotgalibacillus alimentarius]|uniref:Uroporphyrinogen-III synthase n=1 Tax=Jeotgalibacillus alimentarius TaxID=135826 RepID=A0A0C2VWQ9_9BACL|nr:uroporphyrinogen-III synthase [Jeotgalibacillus alimentarius]KIL53312.1 uroporphyrinogen-III synthase [Jeotgalibacillus alimentarius]
MTSLKGIRIVLTRDVESSEQDRLLIEEKGGIPVIAPMIKIGAADVQIDEQKKSQLEQADWIIFTSKNGVYYFCKLVEEAGMADLLTRKKIAAVGRKTAEALENEGMQVHYIPPLYSASSFRSDFKEHVQGPVLFPQGNLSRGEIAKFLNEQGHKCISWTVYENTIPEISDGLLDYFRDADVITLFSPSAAVRFYETVKADHQLISSVRQGRIKIASIGPTTSEAIREMSLPVHIEPSEYTMEAMIEEIAMTLKC